jgi:hypothetical protein
MVEQYVKIPTLKVSGGELMVQRYLYEMQFQQRSEITQHWHLWKHTQQEQALAFLITEEQDII